MPAQARVETRATWNDVDLQSGIRASENKLQGFQHRVQNLFKRSPERRSEQAISGFVADLSSGNVSGAITGITARMTGFGLVLGVAVGAGIELFQKFRGEIKETEAAERKLNTEIATLGGIRGPEEAAKKFEAVRSATEALAKDADRVSTKVQNAFRDIALSFRTGTRAGGTSAGIQSDEIQRGLSGELQLMQDRADAAERNVNIQEEGITASRSQAAVDKTLLDAEIKKSALLEESAKYAASLNEPEIAKHLKPGEKGNLTAANAQMTEELMANADRSAALAVISAKEKEASEERQLNMEIRMADLAASGASVDQQKMAALKEELQIIQDQLSATTLLTDQDKVRLQLAETRAKTRLREARLAEFEKSPAQRIQEQLQQSQRQTSMRAFDKAGGLSNPHYDSNGKLIGGTDPSTGEHVNMGEGTGTLDQTYKSSQDAYNRSDQREQFTQGREYQTPTFGSQLGELGKHMDTYGGSDAFKKAFDKSGGDMAGAAKPEEAKADVVSAVKEVTSTMKQLWAA